MSYESFSAKTRSVKNTLSWIEAKGRKVLFDFSSPTYSFISNFYVSSIEIEGQELEYNDGTLNQGQFYYDPSSSEVVFRNFLDESIEGKSVFIKYRFFFGVLPANISSEHSKDASVHWDGRISNIPSLKLELDYENTGTMVETSSQIGLINNDGFFDEIFDKLIWEGQEVRVYSWSNSIATSEMKLIYKGIILNKTYTHANISFNLKDQVFSLQKRLKTNNFSDIDGRVDETIIDTPKRNIYGQLQYLKCEGVDKILSGYPVDGDYLGSSDLNLLTGRISGLLGNNQVNGNGTFFLTELNIGDKIKIIDGVFEYEYEVATIPSNILITIVGTITTGFTNLQGRNLSVLNNKIFGTGTFFKEKFSPGDEIKVNVIGVEESYRIDSVDSDTEMTLTSEISNSFESMLHSPETGVRFYNRKWNISGHKLRSVNHSVTNIIDLITFELDSTEELYQNDFVLIGSNYRKITGVTGQKIRVNQSVNDAIIGTIVEKIPVSMVYLSTRNFIYARDYEILNNVDSCDILFNEQAEFNISNPKRVSITFAFTNGSSVINSVSSTRDLTTIFSTKNWIQSSDITHADWYEILNVDELSFTIRNPYVGPTGNFTINLKVLDIIDDSSIITCDCLGKETSNRWIRTLPDIVNDILTEAEVDNLNAQSFIDASEDCNFIASLISHDVGSGAPMIRDVIGLVNKSCFGSLYLDKDFNFKYKVLNADKDQSLQKIKDDDILGDPTIKTSNQILSDIELKFRPFTNQRSGEFALNKINISSKFVKETSKMSRQDVFVSYVYNESDARIIGERWAFIRSMSQTIVTLKTKLLFSQSELNEQVFLSLRRFFNRYGSNYKGKIGVINSIDKDGQGCEVSFNDIGNVFNRVGAIAPDDQNDYSSSVEDEIIKYGYIVDNSTETPDILSENELGNNLIG